MDLSSAFSTIKASRLDSSFHSTSGFPTSWQPSQRGEEEHILISQHQHRLPIPAIAMNTSTLVCRQHHCCRTAGYTVSMCVAAVSKPPGSQWSYQRCSCVSPWCTKTLDHLSLIGSRLYFLVSVIVVNAVVVSAVGAVSGVLVYFYQTEQNRTYIVSPFTTPGRSLDQSCPSPGLVRASGPTLFLCCLCQHKSQGPEDADPGSLGCWTTDPILKSSSLWMRHMHISGAANVNRKKDMSSNPTWDGPHSGVWGVSPGPEIWMFSVWQRPGLVLLHSPFLNWCVLRWVPLPWCWALSSTNLPEADMSRRVSGTQSCTAPSCPGLGCWLVNLAVWQGRPLVPHQFLPVPHSHMRFCLLLEHVL